MALLEQTRQPLPDQKVGLLAVALARDPGVDAASAAREVVKAGGGTRTAVLRTLARLQPHDGRQPGPIGLRAAEAMRTALAVMAEDEAGSTRSHG